jgi:predicted DNA-binding transcriptional regulator AlpA
MPQLSSPGKVRLTGAGAVHGRRRLQAQKRERLLYLEEVLTKTGISRVKMTILRRRKLFPQPIANEDPHARKQWRQSDVDEWLRWRERRHLED